MGMGRVRQRQPRIKNEKHLAFIRTLPCLICGSPGCDAAHIRFACEKAGKRAVGIGEKPDDRWTVPLCRHHHTQQHSKNEKIFWDEKGIDPIYKALILWSLSGDHETAEKALLSAVIY